MDPRYLIGIAVVIVMGWFAAGFIYNLRRGDATMKWMEGGLPRIGERTKFQWRGSSVAELELTQAKRPFRSLMILVFLSPRDVPWLWLFYTLLGRRDTLIFRGQLGAQPKVDLEYVNPKTYTGRMGMNQVAGRDWDSEQAADGPMLLLAPKGYIDLARSTVETLAGQRDRLAPTFSRFALRRTSPHFEVHIPLPDYKLRDADEFFESLRALARAVSGE